MPQREDPVFELYKYKAFLLLLENKNKYTFHFFCYNRHIQNSTKWGKNGTITTELDFGGKKLNKQKRLCLKYYNADQLVVYLNQYITITWAETDDYI